MSHGDIVGLLDSSGNEVVTYQYDSWGKLLNIGGSLKDTVGVKNPFRYRSYYYDTETGLYYLQSRYYNPEIGRFISKDDTSYHQGEDGVAANLYAYGNNNPIMNLDPDGHMGRYYWLNSVEMVGRYIDIILMFVSLGKTYCATKALRVFLKANKNRILYQIRGKNNAIVRESCRESTTINTQYCLNIIWDKYR